MSSSSCSRFLATLCCLLALGAAPAWSQSARGTITGTVTDASGAAVPGAEVTATNVETGSAIKTLSTDVGLYRIPYVVPGNYRVGASMAGFRTAVQENVTVLVAQTVTVDFSLQVGGVTDEITVSTEAPLLEKSTSEIGTAATELEVHTWPILVGDGTRQLQDFVFRTMPGTQGGTWEGSINGGQSFAHEILIDGISIGRMDINGGSNNEFTPTVDAVSEFKLQTGATSAQYGNSQTGLTNFALKGGTNEFHGTAFWFHQNEALNANSWGNNAAGEDKRPFRLHNFGASLGGPLIKDKTHFFFSYEGNRQTNYNLGGFVDSLPIPAFNNGDFSRLLDPNFTKDPLSGTVVGQDALGRPIIFGQIYDPTSSRQLPDGTWIRDPFPGNIIPPNKLSRITQNVLRFALPAPFLDQLRLNTPRVTTCCPVLNIDNYSTNIDHVVNEKHKLRGAFVYNDRSRLRYGSGSHYQLPEPQIPASPLTGDKTQATPGWIVRISEDWNFNPTTLNHFAIGYNRFRNANQSNAFLDGRNWAAELGLQNVGGASFPELNFAGNDPLLSGQYKDMGIDNATGNAPNGSTIVLDDVSVIRGSHSIRFGGEHRRYYINDRSVDTPGTYVFHNENTALPGFATQTGFAYASFLTGVIRQATVGVNRLTYGVRSRTTAFYIQDDWKVRPNFTLNVGLRWDIPQAFTEAKDAMSALNPTKPNPGADNFPGALEFLGDCPGCNGRNSFGETYWREFGPRVGFAWAVGQKTVLRGGYGINYAPPILDGWNYGWFNGFNGVNNINVRTNSRFLEDPSYNWDTPYPPFVGALPNFNPALLNGENVPFYPPETNRLPMTQNWNFGIQRELPWETRLEVNYVGTKGTHLNEVYLGYLNQLDPKHLALGDTLLDDINDHPEIPKPYPSFEGTVAQALRPFPQYRSVTSHRLASGWSNYHSVQATATKHASNGLSFLVAYTFSKSLGNADNALGYGWYGGYGQDIYNRRADYSVTRYHVPHDLRVTWIYQLPFGQNQRFLRSGPLAHIIGGWTMSAIQNYRSGNPLGVTTSGYEDQALFNPGFRPLVLLPEDQQKLGSFNGELGSAYLNKDAFAPLPVTENNIPTRLGNGPRFLPNIRGFSQFSEDFSLLKRVHLGFTETTEFEIRIDVINLFNRVRLADPITDINDSNFGMVLEKTGGPRVIQGGLRVNF
ncbi:MAG: carboxypeptidase regulatory-like domain-containing protein [Acidobacteriota bacterium]